MENRQNAVMSLDKGWQKPHGGQELADHLDGLLFKIFSFWL